MTIRPAIQLSAACAGVLLLGASGGLILTFGIELRSALAIAFGFALLLPAFLDRQRGERDDLDRLTEELARYRRAMFVCFGTALVLYALVTSMRATNAVLNRMASLGAALWLVGFILMFFVVYYGSRRAVVQAAQDDDSFE